VKPRSLIVAGTAAGVGTLGWVAFRLYVRSEVVRVLNEEHRFDETLQSLSFLKALGLDLRLPTAAEFAESLVPIWSTVMPEAAVEDVLAKGRSSRYWPEQYKTGSAAAKLEPYLLAGLRKSAQSGATTEQARTAALLTGITEAVVSSAYKKK
jgi:hypothetical protein